MPLIIPNDVYARPLTREAATPATPHPPFGHLLLNEKYLLTGSLNAELTSEHYFALQEQKILTAITRM